MTTVSLKVPWRSLDKSSSLQEMGSLTVYWSTHSPRGLSAKDTIMAKYCDEEAKTIGTVDQSDAQRCGPIQQRAIHTANPP